MRVDSMKLDYRSLLDLKKLNPDLAKIKEGENNRILIYGLDDHKKAILATLLCPEKGPSLFIFENEKKAKAFFELFQETGISQAAYFPSQENIPFQVFARSMDIESQRAEILSRLAAGEDIVIFASIQSLRHKLLPLEEFKANLMEISLGQKLDLDDFALRMAHSGYRRADLVIKRGDFSIRGGIIDIFPPTLADPVRIELFDDEVDSLRLFDIDSQKSLEKIDHLLLGPANSWGGFFFKKEASILRQLDQDFRAQLEAYERTGAAEAARSLRRLHAELREKVSAGILDNLEDYLFPYSFPGGSSATGPAGPAAAPSGPVPLANLAQASLNPDSLNGGLASDASFSWPWPEASLATILDYLPAGAPVFLDEPKRLAAALDLAQREEEKIYSDLVQRGRVFKRQYQIYLTSQEFTQALGRVKSHFLALLPSQASFDLVYENRINADFLQDLPPLFNLGQQFFHYLKERISLGFRIFISLDQEGRKEALKEEAQHQGLSIQELGAVLGSAQQQSLAALAPGIYFASLNLEKGLEDKKSKNIFLTQEDIFHKKKKRSSQIYSKDSERIGSVTDLEIGDFVVHTSHGIGQYFGISSLDVQGIKNDYLLIKYKGEDKLYVPVEQVHYLQKFIGSEEKRPKLNKLGGSDWQRTKARVQQSIEDMSEELLELYARRSMNPGYAFSADDSIQQEFEDNFPWEETPDQLTAIRDIKKDMEKNTPMDRLLCGDVGYGKTEVAMRAAFKAVRDSKQVALLVPTTILAEQHFHTFTQRFADFPVTIEVLSRFKSAAEEKTIKEKTAKGQVDILIGTHKLLSQTLKFKDLGLLIVDEEQRFGVRHKEKIKQLKENVDVLTLSATPIPRTLQMSLAGLRDMSLIETPPKNRYPIQTFVVEKNDDLLQEVIQRELGREGQVYYVHNRVKDIHLEASKLMELLPQATFAVAHGQMKENELEKTMLDFMEGGKDCLISTTIIETGLDIPNVNTLIVDEADKYGLSQLYQLRGRVGRSQRVAYAYLTYKADKMLTENAEKRLKAIKDFTELGSGFKIALRDLEIRGAGNLLGKEQHGHLDAIGFALYTQMLQETIEELKIKKQRELGLTDQAEAGQAAQAQREKKTEISLPISALIPEDYMANPGLKLDFYQKIKTAANEEALLDLSDELIDRFGDYPEETENLFELAKIRIEMEALGLESLKLKGKNLEILVTEGTSIEAKTIIKLSENFKGQVTFKDDNGFMIRYSMNYQNKEELLKKTQAFLKKLGGNNHEKL